VLREALADAGSQQHKNQGEGRFAYSQGCHGEVSFERNLRYAGD
jgi:hypothetical protein